LEYERLLGPFVKVEVNGQAVHYLDVNDAAPHDRELLDEPQVLARQHEFRRVEISVRPSLFSGANLTDHLKRPIKESVPIAETDAVDCSVPLPSHAQEEPTHVRGRRRRIGIVICWMTPIIWRTQHGFLLLSK
jgi:hypothetical protein